MRTISTALITIPFPPRQLEALTAALAPARVLVVPREDRAAVAEAAAQADVAFLGSELDDSILHSKTLRWVHCDQAGLTGSAKPEVFARGLLVTGSAGRTAPALSEHAILFMLALTYDLPGLLHQQSAHVWGGLPGYGDRRGLLGKTAGIVGVGHLGSQLALYLHTLGMTVLGYRRRSEAVPFVDELFSADAGDTLAPLLERSDYVILAAPLSDATYHLIGESELAQMKPTAYLINMCRGAVVDEAALIAALRSHTLAGAGVDTTETEPLPAHSALWDTPNLIITPHSTPTVPDRWQRSLDIMLDNLSRYLREEPLRNLLTPRDVFTHK